MADGEGLLEPKEQSPADALIDALHVLSTSMGAHDVGVVQQAGAAIDVIGWPSADGAPVSTRRLVHAIEEAEDTHSYEAQLAQNVLQAVMWGTEVEVHEVPKVTDAVVAFLARTQFTSRVITDADARKKSQGIVRGWIEHFETTHDSPAHIKRAVEAYRACEPKERKLGRMVRRHVDAQSRSPK